MNPFVKTAPILLLLVAASATRAQPEPLGRLFFTPEQRALLDRQRQLNQAGPLVDDSPVTLNGRVSRSSGRNTAWINGTPFNEAEAKALGRIPSQPGQTLRSASDHESTDLLNGGTISVHRPATHR